MTDFVFFIVINSLIVMATVCFCIYAIYEDQIKQWVKKQYHKRRDKKK